MHKPVITVKVCQDDTPVRGNAMASGDDAFDKQVEDGIIERLESGDVWAWALVEVKASYKGLEASDFLGCCSYESEEDFLKSGDYFVDMACAAISELQKQLEELQSPIVLEHPNLFKNVEDVEVLYR